MTLEEWHEVLATKPATPGQVGAILHAFQCLGFSDEERAMRLALSARLLDLDGLASTRDLVMGDAGRLLRLLGEFGDRAEFEAAASPLPETLADRTSNGRSYPTASGRRGVRTQERETAAAGSVAAEPATAAGAPGRPGDAGPGPVSRCTWADVLAATARALYLIRNPGLMLGRDSAGAA
jgi:hypothetical protein